MYKYLSQKSDWYKTNIFRFSHCYVPSVPGELDLSENKSLTKISAFKGCSLPRYWTSLSISQNNLIFVQGPVEVAVVFLKDSPENKSQDVRHRNKLRLSFKDFLKKYVQVADVDVTIRQLSSMIIAIIEFRKSFWNCTKLNYMFLLNNLI